VKNDRGGGGKEGKPTWMSGVCLKAPMHCSARRGISPAPAPSPPHPQPQFILALPMLLQRPDTPLHFASLYFSPEPPLHSTLWMACHRVARRTPSRPLPLTAAASRRQPQRTGHRRRGMLRHRLWLWHTTEASARVRQRVTDIAHHRSKCDAAPAEP